MKKQLISMVSSNWKRFWMEEEAVGVVEIILILVILVAMVVIFKDKIVSLVSDAFTEIDSGAEDVSDDIVM